MAKDSVDNKRELLGDVKVELTVELGRTSKSIKEALDFAPGSIVELDKALKDPVNVYINKMLYARGEVVTIDESFGVRVTDIMSKEQRYSVLQKMMK